MGHSSSFFLRDGYVYTYLTKQNDNDGFYLNIMQDGNSSCVFFHDREQLLSFFEQIEKSLGGEHE